jgi:hypothetical protein
MLGERLANRFFFEDRCALPNQMRFLLTFPWRGFVLAVRDSDRANKNEISISIFGVAAKDFSHDVLLDPADRC